MFKTLIEKLRIWSHPDFVNQHTRLRVEKLNSDFNWGAKKAAKEGRKFIEIYHYPHDDIDLSVEKTFCTELEAKGFTTKIEGSVCHYIIISWKDGED